MEGGGEDSEDPVAPQASSASGVVELEYNILSKEEISELLPDKPPRSPPFPSSASVVAEQLSEALESLEEGGVFEGAVILLHRPADLPPLTHELERLIAEGGILTNGDYAASRAELLEERRLKFREHATPLLAALEGLGRSPSLICDFAPCVVADLTAADIEVLSTRPDVRSIAPPIEEPMPSAVDGLERIEAYQADLFWDKPVLCGSSVRSFDGDRSCSQNIHVAVADSAEFLVDHVGFTSDSSGTSRIKETWSCSSSVCAANPTDWNPPDGIHGTQTLGALLQDFRDGQQSGFSTTAQRRRSATAGEAAAYLFEYTGTNSYIPFVNKVISRSPISMLVESQAGSSGDCDGEEIVDIVANAVYDAGIPYFISAGNSGGSSSDCRVGDPGAAIGLFTVASYDQGAIGNACDTETGPVRFDSSWGGATTGTQNGYDEGKGRSVIDITGAWRHDEIATSASTTAVGQFAGTSAANPSVASVAIGVVDMFKTHVGTNFIDNPGVLYAWMLNMADRASSTSSSKMTSRFDHRMGAGRVGARFLSSEGMDAPWKWGHYSLCVGDGGVANINIGTLNGDIESFRAVAWWYDTNHEVSGAEIDDVDLRLVDLDTGLPIRTSTDNFDNKERVFHGAVGGRTLQLQVIGSDVEADNTGCGTNRMRVYVTYLAEDDDRDDGNGPSYDALTCEGVENL